jgi:hypothetical protein
MILAVKKKDTPALAELLAGARERGYVASELNILFNLLPFYIQDPNTPVTKLLNDGKRARVLCLEMLDALAGSSPQLTETMQQIEELFQLSIHPNPEMKIVHRLDWLTREDYNVSATKPGHFEVKEEVFIKNATKFLGRELVKCMIGIIDRMARSHTSISMFNDKINILFDAMQLSEEVLRVTTSMLLYCNY